MKNGDNLQGRCFGAVNDQGRVNLEELHRLIRQILAPMSGTRVRRQKDDLLPNDRLNAIRDFNVALFLDEAQILTRSSAASGARTYRRVIQAWLSGPPGKHQAGLRGFLGRGRVARCRAQSLH